MNDLKYKMLLRFVKLLNVMLMAVPFGICWTGYYTFHSAFPMHQQTKWLVIGLFVVIYTIFGRIYEAFLVSLHRISEMVYSQAIAALVSDGILFFIIWILNGHFPNPVPMMICLAAQSLIAMFWSYFAHHWYFRIFPSKKTVIIYDVRRGMEDLIREYGLDRKFQIIAACNAEECLKEKCRVLEQAEAVFLCGVHSTDRNVILKYCVAEGISVYVIPRIGDVLMSAAKRVNLFHLPMLRVNRYNPAPEYLFLKRIFDFAVSAAALVVTSPIMLVTAAAIKLTDGGPVFYKQCRLTKDGKEFNVLKFRSMRVDAEKDGVARLSTGDKDDRITPVGRFIRKVRIDELPQLFNILWGDMSIVGPRPERPEIAKQYEKELPEFALRLQAKAGLTGLAQVYGKYNTTPYDKLQMDLMYIANPSVLEDLRIMFATVKILFMPESTEGVAEGQATAMEVALVDGHRKEQE